MPRVTKATNKKEAKSTGKSAVKASASTSKEKAVKEKTTTKKAVTKTAKKVTAKVDTKSVAKKATTKVATKKTPSKSDVKPTTKKATAKVDTKSVVKKATTKVAAKKTTSKSDVKPTTKKAIAKADKKTVTKKESPKADKKAISKKETSKVTAKSPAKKSSTKVASKTTSKKETTKVAKKAVVKKATVPKKSTKKVTKKVTSKTNKSTTTKKKPMAEKPKVTSLEYYDLPYRYNQTVVKILAQTPSTLFVYWDISDSDREKYIKEFGEYFFNDTIPVLIVHNKTKNYYFEIEINDFANSWYFHVSDAHCDYEIEFGRRKKAFRDISIPNDYVYITSSNVIEAPNDKFLFDPNTRHLFFRNVKTNQEFSKDIATLSFMEKISKIYNIYDVYKEIYKEEDLIDAMNNPTSSGSSPVYRKKD